MNYAAALSTIFCSACAAECHLDELHDEHTDLCVACGDDLAAAKAKEDAADFRFLARDWFTRDLRIKTLAECFDAREAMRVAS